MRSIVPAAFALALLTSAPSQASAAAPADSSSSRGGVRVFSDRALFDLNPRPAAGDRPAAVRDTLGLPSPGGAFALTAAGAFAPVVLLGTWNGGGGGDATLAVTAMTAIVLGPSLGYWYAGIPGDAVPGQLLRLGALGLFCYSLISGWENSDVAESPTLALMVVSGVGYFGGTLYDLGNVGPSVQRANERRRAAVGVSLRPLEDGSPAVAFTVRFPPDRFRNREPGARDGREAQDRGPRAQD